MTLQVEVVTDVGEFISEAAELVSDAFPLPFLEMNAAFLAWALRGVADPARPGWAAIARQGGRVVGFIGAAPRPLILGDVRDTGYIASFVSTAPDVRGSGLATGLYAALLDRLAPLHVAVLTYTIGGSVADRLTNAAYKRAGFFGQSLEPLVAWGAMRGRLRPGRGGDPMPHRPTVALDLTPQVRAHLDADPRGARALSGGGEIVAAWRKAVNGRDPLLIMDLLPASLDGASLATEVQEGFAAFPDHGRQLTVPAVPESGAAVAEAAGLRRLTVEPYVPSIWAPDASHPFLQARRTTHPIL